jgi:PadR family transcriptional regulator, regulatory protein PadR
MREGIAIYIFELFIYRASNIYYMNKLDDDECCDMRGLLGFLILFLLSKKSMHGQEIADEIAKRKGEKPSPGTIYPALKSLRDSGFLDEQKEGKTIIYNLTQKGKKALEIAKTKFSRTFLGVLDS